MENDLDFYMGLNYPYLIKKFCEEDGGGFFIKIPLLEGCMADGDTIEEAFKNIKRAKENYISSLLEYGLDVPEPEQELLK